MKKQEQDRSEENSLHIKVSKKIGHILGQTVNITWEKWNLGEGGRTVGQEGRETQKHTTHN